MSKVDDLYTYLKDKYGVTSKDATINTVSPIEKKNGIKEKNAISILGLPKKNKNHEWIIMLETDDDPKSISLVVGQRWKDEHCSWSRYFQVIDYTQSKYPGSLSFRKVSSNEDFNEEELNSLKTLLEVFSDFLKLG